MAQQPRLIFESDGESLSSPIDDTSPTYSSTALARFEFEFGRGNEGTKILMVEWEAEAETASAAWEVSWEGKSTVLSAKDNAEAKEKDNKTHRLYFLLAPGATIPPTVKIAQKIDRKQENKDEEEAVLYANSLPAIFPKELGLSGREKGKKGVLHTIWAKKRLEVLRVEIEREAKNAEGIGLDMAIREREWIVENFGVGGNPPAETASPRTPSGRLSEKLKGLKLGTSASELQARPASEYISHRLCEWQSLIITDSIPAHLEKESAHPLSPDMGDVALSSFALFHGATASRPVKTPVPQHQSISHQIAASRNSSRMSSMDAITSGEAGNIEGDDDPEDDLFVVKMSPRSPEMTKSPFSFTDANGPTLTWGK